MEDPTPATPPTPPTPPTPRTPPTQPGFQPTCWKCGYALSGLRVDGVCPECNTPIWGPRVEATDKETDSLANSILVWGIVSLCLTFVCLGPLAGFLTIPAFVKNKKFRILYESGAATRSQAGTVKAGMICARIAALVSIALVALYVAVFGAGAFL